MICDICGREIKNYFDDIGSSIIVVDPDGDGNPSREEDTLFQGKHIHRKCYDEFLRDVRAFIAQRISWRVHLRTKETDQ